MALPPKYLFDDCKNLMIEKFEYIIRRLLLSVGVLIGLTLIVFVLTRVIPSNPASLYLGPRARPAEIERVNKQLGLDKPLPAQYLDYVGDVVRGDWGNSISSKQPVLDEITSRLPATMELVMVAMLLAVVVGTPLGVLSAQLHGKLPDVVVRIISLVGVSMPAFYLGLLLQLLLFHKLGLFFLTRRFDGTLRFTHPIDEITGFYLFDTAVTGNWVAFKDVAGHLVLPALTLAAYPIGLVARMTRATMLEVMEQNYIRTARAYGILERFILYNYALRNAIVPTLTVIGLTLAYLLTGAFYVEYIFNWGGLGTFTTTAFLNLDYPAIMGMTLFGAGGYVIINLVVDLAQAWLDPRIRLR